MKNYKIQNPLKFWFCLAEIPNPETSQTAGLVHEVGRLIAFAPNILTKIEEDLDAVALQKKEIRRKDEAWLMEQSGQRIVFPESGQTQEQAQVVLLKTGRPRIPAELVLFFLFFRGMFAGIRGKISKELRSESLTLRSLLLQVGMRKMPGETTILENSNCVTLSTIRYIFRQQIQLYFTDSLDSFLKIFIDSTSTKANSLWPTESGIILSLCQRVLGSFEYLYERYQIGLKLKSKFIQNLKLIRTLHLRISMGTGRKNSKQKRKASYRKLIKLGRKVLCECKVMMVNYESDVSKLNILPSERDHIQVFLDMMNQDIADLEKTINNAETRVLNEDKVETREKVLSTSDPDASIIAKGGREPVLGYKPNVSRSEKGFIVGIEVPMGNASDSSVAVDLVKESMKNTGVTPDVASFDDGYTSAENKLAIEDLGVAVVSFSGSKGRKITGDEEYYQSEFQEARNERSMAESVMNELKNVQSMGHHGRRGIEQVRSECLEIALAHNAINAVKLRSG